MKAILLDGSYANDVTGERVRTAFKVQLEARGWEVEYVVLRSKEIGICAGDFFCWVRTPGVCNVDDDNRAIAAAIVASDVVIYFTPVTFGGYSSALKRMVDHQIQNVSPYFTRIAGETHHQKRYDTTPGLLAVGWMDLPDTQAAAVFRHLVQRNAINFHAKTCVSSVVLASQSDEQLVATAENCLTQMQSGQSTDHAGLPAVSVTVYEPSEIRRALLLVGSPKTHKSTSNSLGAYLFELLNQQGVQTETIHVHAHLRSPKKMQALLAAVDAADLVTLAFPLYVDSLPAPVIETLERIAAHRLGRHPRRQLFAAIANCGFPEGRQLATALAICETFARQSHFAWAGSLALGGGEMIKGVPLAEGGRRTIRIRKSLELASKALMQGQVIPQAAQNILEQPVIPNWMYRLIGRWGWKQQAKHYGAEKSLQRQPYLMR